MGNAGVSGKKRLAITLVGVAVIFFLLILRLAWFMLIRGSELRELASNQQTQDTSLTASRGAISDAPGGAGPKRYRL